MNKIIYVFYVLIVSLVLSEIVVRAAINWIPEGLIEYLSPNAMLHVYKERGKVQEENSPIYHYKPFQKMNLYPYIKIDENGYRNSKYNQNEVDTVLLGDSIIFARESEVDLGEIFRENGKSALNLAIGGYAPQHYRDVYEKYVIDKNVPHKNVVVNIFVGNDFGDSMRYPWELKPVAKGSSYFPWVINLMIGVVDTYQSVRNYNIEIKESKHRISLPYREIGIRYLWWTPEPSDKEWSEISKALDDILKMANQAGAEMTIVIVPSPASVYGVQLYSDFSVYVDRHNKIVNEFKSKLDGVNIVDLNNELAVEIEKEFLYIDDSDAHFNAFGTRLLFDIVFGKLRS